MEFNEILREYRIKAGHSQKEVADLLDLTDRAVSNYELGIRLPDWHIIKALRKVLNIPVEILLGVEELKREKSSNPFFTSNDFIRFCATWEYRDGGYDLDKGLLKRDGEHLSYTVFREEPYLFQLLNGQITFTHQEWDSDFIENFYGLLSELAGKKIYNEPARFEVSYETNDYKEEGRITKTVIGFDNDSETDVFILANSQAVLNDEETLTECYGFEWKELITL